MVGDKMTYKKILDKIVFALRVFVVIFKLAMGAYLLYKFFVFMFDDGFLMAVLCYGGMAGLGANIELQLRHWHD